MKRRILPLNLHVSVTRYLLKCILHALHYDKWHLFCTSKCMRITKMPGDFGALGTFLKDEPLNFLCTLNSSSNFSAWLFSQSDFPAHIPVHRLARNWKPLFVSIKSPPTHVRKAPQVVFVVVCLFSETLNLNFLRLISSIWSAAVSVLDSGLVGLRVVVRTVEFIMLLCVMWPFCLTCFPGLIKEHN